MTKNNENLESQRLELQVRLDAGKDKAERNRMGQFATPTTLAREILQYAVNLVDPAQKIKFIDPAIGTGSFYSALRETFPKERLEIATGYEIDPHYGVPAQKLWGCADLKIRLEDFTKANPKERFNLLICNPPYTRHHHIHPDEKKRLRTLTSESCGVEINGLSGLHCYFIGLSHRWMEPEGLAGWLMPSEFMDVNYGALLKKYLLDRVTLRHIHRFDPQEVQFDDALVSSAIVWFNATEPPPNHQVRMSYGGSLNKPRLERLVAAEILRADPKWTQYPTKENWQPQQNTPVLGHFFKIQRGLATGNNKYFILKPEDIQKRDLPADMFRPVLPSPRYMDQAEIKADREGNPILNRKLFLLDSTMPEDEIGERYPSLMEYLEAGKDKGVDKGYLCEHRKPWYRQENRPAAPFLLTYMGRTSQNRHPFRFFLNQSRATAANVYLMLYPTGEFKDRLQESPELLAQVWEFLKRINPEDMLSEGRVYGGGLHKLEPKELGRVPAQALADLLS